MLNRRIAALALLLALLVPCAAPACAESPAFKTAYLAGRASAEQASYLECLCYYECINNKTGEEISNGIAYPVGYTSNGETLLISDFGTLQQALSTTDGQNISVKLYTCLDDTVYQIPRYRAMENDPGSNPLMLLIAEEKIPFPRIPSLVRSFSAKSSPCFVVGLSEDESSFVTAKAVLGGGEADQAKCTYQMDGALNLLGQPVFDEDNNLIGVMYEEDRVASAGYAMELLTAQGVAYQETDYKGTQGLPVWVYVLLGAAVAGLVVWLIARAKKRAVQPIPAPPVVETYDLLSVYGVNGEMEGKQCDIEGRLNIGRDAQTCGMVYDRLAPGISAVHCSLLQTSADTVDLVDMGSSYGTFVGEERLAPHEPKQLRVGEQFYLGDCRNTFEIRKKVGA